jgi:hypothetical protein
MEGMVYCVENDTRPAVTSLRRGANLHIINRVYQTFPATPSLRDFPLDSPKLAISSPSRTAVKLRQIFVLP